MSVLLMTLASLLGSTYSRTNLKSFKSLRNFKPLLNNCLTKRLLQFKLIGVVSTKDFISFLVKSVPLTTFHAPMLINRMGQLSINIIT
jgi:hypothetical protein